MVGKRTGSRANFGFARFRDVVILCFVAGLATPGAVAEDPDNCLLCHQYRGLSRYNPEQDAIHLYFVSPDFQHRRLGAHARLGCTDCHPRDEVGVIPHQPTSPVDCTRTCHLQNPYGVAHNFSHANVQRVLDRSVHSSARLEGLKFADGPLLHDGQSQCLYCHDEQLYRSLEDVIPLASHLGSHAVDRCDSCHVDQIPTDTEFYLRHVASRILHARPPLEMAQSCSVCHSDPKIRETFDLQDASAGFAKSYHGKAALLGDKTTADCVDCHATARENDHLILAQADPRSATHLDHRSDTCRSLNCHPGAEVRFGQASVHFDIPSLGGWEIALAAAFVILTLATFGPSLVLTILELFQIVIGRHVHGEKEMRDLTIRVLQHPQGRAKLQRFTAWQRVQHWILVILFGGLVLTGFPMKFADHGWAREVVRLLGGLGNARLIHHWAGIALIAGFTMHLLTIVGMTLRTALRRREDGKRTGLIAAVTGLPLFIGFQDAKKAALLMGYLVGLRREPPSFDRFSIDQKFEYIGVFWGTMLLGATGLLLWFEQFSSQFVTGRVLNLALIAHTYEAFLAVIHVGILHLCNVMLAPTVFPFSPATLTGNTPVTRLAEVHADQVVRVARELGITDSTEVQHG